MIVSMRRALLLSGSLPLVVLACFSQSSGGGGVTFDASNDSPSFDSSMPESEAPEASQDAPAETSPIVDSGVDAVKDVVSEPSGPPVTVTVVSASGAEMGVLVVFQDDTGNVLGTPTTDANGTAAVVVPAGSSVTVVSGSPSAANLYTVLDVTPGMSFVVPDWSSAPSPTVQLTSVPSPSPDGGVEFFWFMGGFATMTFPSVPFEEPLSLTSDQRPYGIGHFGSTVGGALPTLVESVTAGGSVLGWAGVKDQPLAPLDDAGLLEVNVGGSWNTTSFTENVTVDEGDASVISSGSYFEEAADGVLLPIWGGPYATHPGFADFAQGEADIGSNGFAQVVVTRIPTPAANGTLTIDASNIGSLPVISNAGVSLTAGQPTLSWTLSQGSSAGATGVVAQASWSATLPDGGAQVGSWTVVSPSNAGGSVTAPLLPTALAAYGPAAGATFSVQNMWLVSGQTGVPSYADLVGMAGSFWSIPTTGCISGPFAPPLPADGTAAFAIYAPNDGGGC